MIGAVIKQVGASLLVVFRSFAERQIKVQNILVDPKSQELLDLLKKERMHGTLTTQDQIKSRQNAERILGPDENLFRIDWVRPPIRHSGVIADQVSSSLKARS